jgi:uncharacterized membrane protein
VEKNTMNARIILASVTGVLLLASPMAAGAKTSKAPATSTSASKDACKGLKDKALKDCQSKAATSSAKKTDKTK